MATKKVILKEIVDGVAGDSIHPQTSIDMVEGLQEELAAAGSVSTISVNGGTPLTPDGNKNIDITIPSTVTESTVENWGFTKNAGTITGITMNNVSKGIDGIVNLGTVITDVSDKANSADVYTIEQVDDIVENVVYFGNEDASVTTIDFDSQSDTVWNKAQVLSAAQQAQARTNIGAGTVSSITINGTTYNPTNGNVDLGTVSNSDISILNYIKNKFDGKRCAIVGDSISTYQNTMPSGYDNYYPHSGGDVQSVNDMWWKIVCTILGMTPVNCSWSGSKVTGYPKGSTAQAACSDQRILDMGRNGIPDVIIFFIGCNDWATDTELHDTNWTIDDTVIDDSGYTSETRLAFFNEAYSLMLYKTKIAYPHALIYCCTIMDEIRRDDGGVGVFPPINKPTGGVSNYTWNQNIKAIAEAYGASIIDMHDCGVNYFNLEQYYSVDASQGALHPNKAGHALMARKVISQLIAK